MGWRAIRWYGHTVYVQKVSLFYKLKKFLEDMAVRKIKNGSLWA